LKVSEIRSLSIDELKKQLEESHRELFDLRFKLAVKQLVNHRQLRSAKKRIARLETLLRERESGIR
jgi:large subunit ribosomal protein L29